ncbi:MAG: NADH-quinone oxidoreductase subunit C [Anaerolineales bacterium]
MTTVVEGLLPALRQRLGETVREARIFRGEVWLEIAPEAVVAACRDLRDDPALEFRRLSALTAVDRWPAEPRFEIVYQLYSFRHRAFLGLLARVHGETGEIDSLESVFPNANWHEREVFDMFGVPFRGHSDLRRILMPFDWVGHPLRKDYPLGYEEVQFSFNAGEIDRRKPYAAE